MRLALIYTAPLHTAIHILRARPILQETTALTGSKMLTVPKVSKTTRCHTPENLVNMLGNLALLAGVIAYSELNSMKLHYESCRTVS